MELGAQPRSEGDGLSARRDAAGPRRPVSSNQAHNND